MNKVLITHNDFDGVTCAILFKAVHPDGVYFLESYDSIDKRIKQVLDENPEIIYITDISPQSEEVTKLLDQFGKARLFDHHKTALHLNEYTWATVESNHCGAWLFHEYLTWIILQPVKMWQYNDLVILANDYDLWHHQDPRSKILNSLLYTIGHERFISRFMQNPSVELTEAEKYLFEIEREKDERYITEATEAAKVYDSFAITFAEKLISQIGHKMLETLPIDIAVIINSQKGVVSLRSKEVDASVLAKALGGGGHPKAAGFTLPKYLFHDEVANLIAEILQEKGGSSVFQA